MGLSEIARGLAVTTEQRERGVSAVDDTGSELIERIRQEADAVPCTPEGAVTAIEAFQAGASVGDAAREAGLTPMDAAKTLHRCGIVGVCPFGPTAREIVRDWLDGDLSRHDALALTGGSKAEFALTTYIETHEPVPTLVDAVEGASQPSRSASVAKRDQLGGALGTPDGLR